MSPSRAALLSNQVKGLMCWLVAYTMKIRSFSFGSRSKTQCTESTGQGWKVLFLRKTLELQVFKKVRPVDVTVATCGQMHRKFSSVNKSENNFISFCCPLMQDGTFRDTERSGQAVRPQGSVRERGFKIKKVKWGKGEKPDEDWERDGDGWSYKKDGGGV